MPANQLLGVELARVGTWDLAIGGRRSFTAEDFADAVAASLDPDYGIMPIRPGHTDPRFDGEPALGRVVNLRTAGDRLIGDLVDLPAWLTQRIHAAYPERSVEGYTNVTSPTGRKYRLVLTSLALLGVAPPAMKGLADLPAAVAAGAEPIAASSAVMDLADAPPSGADGLEGLRRVAAEIAALGESEPPARETVTVTGDEPQPSEGSLMDPIRTALGLTADATDEQVSEALAAQATALTEARSAAEAAAARIAELEATTTQPPVGLPEGAALIDQAQLAELRVAAAQGAEAHATLRQQERDRFISRHIAAGRLAPSASALRSSLEREWDRDPEAAEQVAASLAVVMPTMAMGTDTGAESPSGDALYAELFGTDKTGA